MCLNSNSKNTTITNTTFLIIIIWYHFYFSLRENVIAKLTYSNGSMADIQTASSNQFMFSISIIQYRSLSKTIDIIYSLIYHTQNLIKNYIASPRHNQITFQREMWSRSQCKPVTYNMEVVHSHLASTSQSQLLGPCRFKRETQSCNFEVLSCLLRIYLFVSPIQDII